jgi:hypothetical protein
VSTDWDVWCADCHEEVTALQDNRSVALCRTLILAAPALAILGQSEAWPALRKEDFELSCFRGRVDPSAFAKHAGHHLVTMSEYGEIDGRCSRHVRVYWTEQDWDFAYCMADPGHSGPPVLSWPPWKKEEAASKGPILRMVESDGP